MQDKDSIKIDTNQIKGLPSLINSDFIDAVMKLTESIEKSCIEISKVLVPVITESMKNMASVVDGLFDIFSKDKDKALLQASQELIARGWYINYFFNSCAVKKTLSDEDLMDRLKESMDDIQDFFSNYCKNRYHVIKEAITLHNSGYYYGSTVLFLTQADGVTGEIDFPPFHKFPTKGRKWNPSFRRNKSPVFKRVSKHRRTHKSYKRASYFNQRSLFFEILRTNLESGRIFVNRRNKYLINTCRVASQNIFKDSSRATKGDIKGPNRHGIIHGSLKHLDYGSKLNSYKALSFLLFCVELFKKYLKFK